MNKRFATPDDYTAKRKFVCVRMEVSDAGIVISDAHELTISHVGSPTDLRFGPFGSIRSNELGMFRYASHGVDSASGRVIDYAENLQTARASAIEAGNKIRAEFVARLEERLETMRNAPLVIGDARQ